MSQDLGLVGRREIGRGAVHGALTALFPWRADLRGQLQACGARGLRTVRGLAEERGVAPDLEAVARVVVVGLDDEMEFLARLEDREGPDFGIPRGVLLDFISTF